MSDELLTMVEQEVLLQPIVSVSDLAKTYASGLQALKDINLEIRCGEIFALLGPNGAGKSCGSAATTSSQSTARPGL